MAMIDYGAIAWKDGKLISTDMFTDMEEMVGWTDKDSNLKVHEKLDGNWFAYIGDKDLTICFYKYVMYIYCPNDSLSHKDTIYFGSENYEEWCRWHTWVFPDKNDCIDLIVTPVAGHEYYICKMKYRGHKYKVAFGHGVDLDYYKKFHIIDYYGTPWFKISELYGRIKDKIIYR